MPARGADLIVECAHPDVSVRHREAFLAHADYLPLSVNALADPTTETRLLAAATASGRRLLIPHGALIGLDNLVEMRASWRAVTITFRKDPGNIDFAESGIDPGTIRGITAIYDGPVRGIARIFPRNVNTMTTCALATVGLDRCRVVLIADPSLDVAIADILAEGHDGSIRQSRKVQPVVGLSGTEMFEAQIGSVQRAAGVALPGLAFVWGAADMTGDAAPAGAEADSAARAAHGIVLTDLLSHLLRRAHFEAEALFAVHNDGLDVTSRQLALLFAIARLPGAPQTVLAEHVGLDANTFSDLANRSQRKGLIRKQRSSKDRRANGLQLTDLGRRTIAAAATLTPAYQRRLAGALSEGEAAELVRLLRKLLALPDTAAPAASSPADPPDAAAAGPLRAAPRPAVLRRRSNVEAD